MLFGPGIIGRSTWRVDPIISAIFWYVCFEEIATCICRKWSPDSVFFFSRKKKTNTTKLKDVFLEAVESLAGVAIVEVSPWGFGVVSNVILPCLFRWKM